MFIVFPMVSNLQYILLCLSFFFILLFVWIYRKGRKIIQDTEVQRILKYIRSQNVQTAIV